MIARHFLHLDESDSISSFVQTTEHNPVPKAGIDFGNVSVFLSAAQLRELAKACEQAMDDLREQTSVALAAELGAA